jgi:ribosomal protein S30
MLLVRNQTPEILPAAAAAEYFLPLVRELQNYQTRTEKEDKKKRKTTRCFERTASASSA